MHKTAKGLTEKGMNAVHKTDTVRVWWKLHQLRLIRARKKLLSTQQNPVCESSLATTPENFNSLHLNFAKQKPCENSYLKILQKILYSLLFLLVAPLFSNYDAGRNFKREVKSCVCIIRNFCTFSGTFPVMYTYRNGLSWMQKINNFSHKNLLVVQRKTS